MYKYEKMKLRRSFLLENIDEVGAALEIGALNSPLLSKDKYQYFIMDWLDQDGLIEKYPNKENIRPVDYIIKEKRLSKALNEKFNTLVACHVIEHIPDIVSWFDELHAISEEGAALFLVVPDKRYTFDINRANTKLSEILLCHYLDLEMPHPGQLFEHLYEHRKVNLADVWAGNFEKDSRPRMSIATAWGRALEMSTEYHSVHCHVFERESFETLMHQLHEIGLIKWKMSKISSPAPGSNEFFALMDRLG